MKFTNLGSNIIVLLLLSALGWGGVFALFAVGAVGAPPVVGWSIVSLFLLGILICLGLMGLEIFRPGDTHPKQDVMKQQSLGPPPEVPAQELDDFTQTTTPQVHPLPGLQISLPTLAPLQQHALGGVIVRQMQPPASQSPATLPIAQSTHPQEATVSSGHTLGT